MDSKPILKFLLETVGKVLATADDAATTPTTPCKEVVVLDARGLRTEYSASAEMHPAFRIAAAHTPYSFL